MWDCILSNKSNVFVIKVSFFLLCRYKNLVVRNIHLHNSHFTKHFSFFLRRNSECRYFKYYNYISSNIIQGVVVYAPFNKCSLFKIVGQHTFI